MTGPGTGRALVDHVSQPGQAPQFFARRHWQRYERRPTKRIVVLLMVLALLATRCADATTPAPQRAALVDLWNGVTGLASACPDWASGDPCSNGWSTVTCSSAPVAITYVVVGEFQPLDARNIVVLISAGWPAWFAVCAFAAVQGFVTHEQGTDSSVATK